MKAQSLEGQLYTGQFDDGLLDLFVGMGLLGTGIVWLTDLPAFTGVVPAVLIPLWIAVRKRFTEPRLGSVRFRAERQRTERRWLAWMLVAGAGVLGIVLAGFVWTLRGAAPSGRLQALVPLLPGFLIGVGLVLVGAMLGAVRFAAYAVGLLVVAAVTTGLGGEPGVYLAAAGGLLCAWAGAVVARFMASHPVLDRE